MSSATSSFTIPLPVDGLLADQPIMAVPPTALIASQNWIYRDGKLTLRPGLIPYGAMVLTGRPLNLVQFLDPTAGTQTVIATTTRWFKANATGTDWVNITGTPLTGGPTQPTMFRVFYKGTPLVPFVVGTNSIDTMKKWSAGAATYSDALGTPPKAVCLAVAANRMILGNLTSGSNVSQIAIDVSSLNDFEAGWGVTLTAFLADTPGPIVTMLESGALTTVVYKTDSIYIMSALSDIVPFRFELKQSGILGPAGPLCVIPITTGIHAYLAADGSLKQFDGVTVKDMGRKFQAFISANIDFPTIARSRVAFDPTRNELWVIFPSAGTSSDNMGMVVNLNNGSLWPLKWDFNSFGLLAYANVGGGPTWAQLVGAWSAQTKTWTEYTGYLPSIVLGDIGGRILQTQGTNDNGATNVINHLFETGMNPLTDDITQFKTVHEIDHLFKRSGASNVISTKLGVVAYGEQRVYSPISNLDTVNAGPYQARFRQSGRLFSLRLEGAANQTTEWEGAGAFMTPRGHR